MLRRRSKKHYALYKEQARTLLHERLGHFNAHYRHKVGRVFIKNSKSRWGSCSSKGNLNFNYKLLFLPVEVMDYVVVHELCHLQEFNHGPVFWALVAQTVPNHKALRQKLRQAERA